MKKTKESQVDFKNRATLNMGELAAFLGCGRKAAETIAYNAEAIVRVGRRVLISRTKVEKYIESIAR